MAATEAINSVWNCETGIKERHFSLQFIDPQFQNMSSSSWKQHLTELPSNDDGNKNLNSFHVAFNSDLPTKDRIKNITEDKYDVVACVDRENIVKFIHSISNLGGTRSQSTDKILGVIGMEQQGICVELITYYVATYCNFPAPSLVDYNQCQSQQ